MVDYYEARAAEYDDWYLRRGRYAHGPIHDQAWAAELDAATLWLDRQPLGGEIVELAAGTGWWSPLLASKGDLSIYDAASAPLDLARDRLLAHGLRAHIHVRDAWAEPDRTVDAVFCGFWLSHVPRARLGAFLELARRWLKPGGSLLAIDSRPDPSSGAVDQPATPEAEAADGIVRRRLADGREFRVVKVVYPPDELEAGSAGRRLPDRRGDDHGAVLRPRSRGDLIAGRDARTAGRPAGRDGGPYTPAMSPLSKRTIATVGSGVMAEAMIAGLLRGELVAPRQVVASHPRRERREELATAYGIRTVASNVEAVDGADVVLLAIKPQMLARVGAELEPHLRDEQLVLSVIAGATTAALEGFLGHRRIVRSMPNTPARLGRGMTVWYATPETTADQRAQASAILRALGVELEVDDERFVAMATAVSGTGPTYVFLVMEALIDAAVHLGFPRHVAHDLVVETLEGSTFFAKQSGDHPAVLRNMVTSPGGTSAAALHELESGRLRTVLSEAVWAAYRRTVELGDQLEAGAPARPTDGKAPHRTAPRPGADRPPVDDRRSTDGPASPRSPRGRRPAGHQRSRVRRPATR